MPHSEYLELLDWRRRVAALFVELRHRTPDADTLDWFRTAKDGLFKAHPQSPLLPDERAAFTGLPYWPYDPQFRVLADFTPLHDVGQRHGTGSEVTFFRIGRLDFTLHDQTASLGAYWIAGYAGGLFVPFVDATSGHASYGGGRYLLDTIKSADLGSEDSHDRIVLDFNYAYHPSCAYDPRWVCPLAPPDNRLRFAVEAGEKSR
ncbi:MAG: DUF1684 domain-containing protein [Chloroflexota bacterium]